MVTDAVRVGSHVRCYLSGPAEIGEFTGTVVVDSVGPIDGKHQRFLIVKQDGGHRNAAPAVLLEEVLEVLE